MNAKQFIVATAGHVDHGKSALVKALTGTDPDRLPEEKARGITIDLGFACLELPSIRAATSSGIQSSEPALLRLGIVDVPGHEDFVKNMVAGVSSIDLALLIVAADDGWMPQTEEHLQILSYLGVKRGLVVLTKIDLAGSDEAGVVGEVSERLRHSPLADAPIIKTSVINGHGLEELKQALAQVLADAPAPRDCGKPRLPVDRVFTLHGIGTVVTGTLTGGSLAKGQAVSVQPAGLPARVRSIQSFNQEVECSGPGTRTALNLPDIPVAGKGHQAGGAEGLRRGQVVSLAELGSPSETLDVLVSKSGRLTGAQTKAARPLKDGSLVRVHHGSSASPARLCLLDQKEITPGEEALAQLRFAAPVFAFVGDRFILRDWAEQATLGGGVVLDPDASSKRFRSAGQKRFLERMRCCWQSATESLEAELERQCVASSAGLLRKSAFSAQEIQQSLCKLGAAGKAILMGHLAAAQPWWEALRERAVSLIASEHKAHPEKGGLSVNQLRSVLGELPAPGVFEALLAELCKSGFTQSGPLIRQTAHRPALPPHLQAAGVRLRAELSNKPLEPPSRKELSADSASQQALRFLLDTGEAVELGEEVIILAESFTQALAVIKKFIGERGSATVSDLRQAVGTSRRIMVPLLEKLDREGITLRQGDRRILKERTVKK